MVLTDFLQTLQIVDPDNFFAASRSIKEVRFRVVQVSRVVQVVQVAQVVQVIQVFQVFQLVWVVLVVQVVWVVSLDDKN